MIINRNFGTTQLTPTQGQAYAPLQQYGSSGPVIRSQSASSNVGTRFGSAYGTSYAGNYGGGFTQTASQASQTLQTPQGYAGAKTNQTPQSYQTAQTYQTPQTYQAGQAHQVSQTSTTPSYTSYGSAAATYQGSEAKRAEDPNNFFARTPLAQVQRAENQGPSGAAETQGAGSFFSSIEGSLATGTQNRPTGQFGQFQNSGPVPAFRMSEQMQPARPDNFFGLPQVAPIQQVGRSEAKDFKYSLPSAPVGRLQMGSMPQLPRQNFTGVLAPPPERVETQQPPAERRGSVTPGVGGTSFGGQGVGGQGFGGQGFGTQGVGNQGIGTQGFGTQPGPNRADSDSVSVSSKMSKTNNPLRPLSINNEDHLFNLHGKEEAAMRANSQAVGNFAETLSRMGEQSLRLVVDNHMKKLNEVWTSYLKDQHDPNLNRQALDNDVNIIKSTFADMQQAKAKCFIEESKKAILDSIYKEIDSRNSKVIFLNDDVRELVDGKCRHVEAANAELKSRLAETRATARTSISQAKAKFDRLKDTQTDANDREFRFKLNGDPNLLRHTMNSAMPLLNQRRKKLDDKLAACQNKSKFELDQLADEVAHLEAQLRYMV